MEELNLMNILGIQEEKIEEITIVAGYNKLGEKKTLILSQSRQGKLSPL
ncbi:hypothetical protein HMPREF9466_03047 [Fusobacterium necrophorum subsp. funduliforme 1_1_36S]|nr:hypothetical protein HMPREF9466_03047 [Fusobacterium necrophorum subsp. funduliforme 1_1_36S]